jgi:hypothetical protein
VRARHDVPIERPRNVVETRENPVFARLLKTLWNELSDETPAARSAAT